LRESCSKESLRARFRHLSKRPTHESAARFCVLDYDRELAIVAERGEGDQRQLVGVAQLLADPNHDTAEFAVLVTDTWQGQGLGLKLTEFCLTIANQWGIRRIVGQTTADNPRMQSIFAQFGFQASEPRTDDLTTFVRELDSAS
jgi:acetyltransferase